MKTVLFFIFILKSFTVVAQSKATEDSIKLTINTFFKGMKNRDTTLIRSTLSSNITLQSLQKNKEGKVIITNETAAAFLNQIATLPESIKLIDERIVFEKILIDDVMALAWTPFELYLNNKFYSCGVNNFQLVKENGNWKINSIIDTRRKDNCKAKL
jgi:hypothetical protein